MISSCDVSIIGAGPYGLSAASHLRSAGVEVRVFGRPMSFWQQHMPKGMVLRSSWRASHISSPDEAGSLDRFADLGSLEPTRNLPKDDFVRYGLWFHTTFAPEVDSRSVVSVEQVNGCFRLNLDDGEALQARRVIVAMGLSGHEWRPPEFDGMPREIVAHSADITDFAAFRGRSVIVIGSGQSAIESAALLNEAGAAVEVVARAPKVHWMKSAHVSSERVSTLGRRLGGMIAPRTEVGPFPFNWLVHDPTAFRALPSGVRHKVSSRVLRPTAAGWLRSRVTGVPVTLGRYVRAAGATDSRVRLTFDDGSCKRIDYVVLATGFRVEVCRMKALSPQLAAAIETRGGLPVLSPTLEASVPGLFFVGAAAVYSFGPVMRFVSGTRAAAQALLRGLSASPSRHWSISSGGGQQRTRATGASQ